VKRPVPGRPRRRISRAPFGPSISARCGLGAASIRAAANASLESAARRVGVRNTVLRARSARRSSEPLPSIRTRESVTFRAVTEARLIRYFPRSSAVLFSERGLESPARSTIRLVSQLHTGRSRRRVALLSVPHGCSQGLSAARLIESALASYAVTHARSRTAPRSHDSRHVGSIAGPGRPSCPGDHSPQSFGSLIRPSTV